MNDLPSRLRAMAGPIVPNVCTEAADEIERLRKERDEARQEICIRECDTLGAVISGSPATPQDYAKEQGWDCFKEASDEG